MRDFLEDAYEHRQDGYGRAQAANKVPLMKRFYKTVTTAPAEGGHAILLDGKNMKTPGGKPVHVPTVALAEAMGREWDAQETEIDFRHMPLVRLVHSAIESGPEGAPAFRDEIVKYAGNDLLLYRADSPDSLVRDQLKHWDPVLDALASAHSVSFAPTVGIIHQPQPGETLSALRATLAAEDHFSLAALMQMVSLTGSALLVLAYRQNLIDSGTVWTAAHVDEDHNIRLWGEDDEATLRRAQRFVEFSAAVDLLNALT